MALKEEVSNAAVPQTLSFVAKHVDQRVFSAKITTTGSIVCGTNFGVQLRNEDDLSQTNALRYSANCYCYALPFSDAYIAFIILKQKSAGFRKCVIAHVTKDLLVKDPILSDEMKFDSSQIAADVDQVYLLNRDSRSVDIYSPDGILTGKIPLEPNSSPRGLHVGRSRLLVVDGYGSLYCYKTDTKEMLWTLSELNKPGAVTSDDNFIYVAMQDGKTISVLSYIGKKSICVPGDSRC